MIESVRFQNFKALRDVELRGLQRLNVLVGPSGVGKTSVLQGLQLVSEALNQDPVFIDFEWLDTRLMTQGTKTSAIEVRSNAGKKLTLKLENARLDSLAHWDAQTKSEFGATVLLALDARKLSSPSISSPDPVIAPDGSGLAGVLAYLAGGYRERIESIEKQLRAVIGITNRIRTFPFETEVEETEILRVNDQEIARPVRRKKVASRFEVEVDETGWIAADLLSEGMLMTLGLISVLHQRQTPRVLLLDDIDKGLHPSAQSKLIASLRSLLSEQPELQIIGTSHSPYLLDHFQPEEVQVMTFASEGHVVAARLDSHPEWLKWKGTLQTGEFWSSVGEEWVSAGAGK